MNGTLRASNYGEYPIRVESIHQGVGFVASEAKSRARKAFYATRATSGSFTADIILASWAEVEHFMSWMRGWVERISNPHHSPIGPMYVYLPSRAFAKVGIIDKGLLYQQSYDSLAYRYALSFVGTSDPIGDIGGTDDVVSFYRQSINDPGSRWYYPPSIPLDGSAAFSQPVEGDSSSSGGVDTRQISEWASDVFDLW